MNHGPLTHLDLFSGIGGFALAADRAFGKVEHTFCETDPFCRAVLGKHWPDAPIHGDIRALEPGPAYLVTGGFPCQPFSAAGKRKGTQDDRYLWPEMLRVIRLSAPAWVIGENVGGLLTWDGGLVLERVLVDLEGAGYEAWPFVIPACSLNAPHRRDRVWIVAHALGDEPQERRAAREDARAGQAQGLRQRDDVERAREPDPLRLRAHSPSPRRAQGREDRGGLPQGEGAVGQQEWGGFADFHRPGSWCDWPAAARELCRVDDGIPRELDTNRRISALGNSIVPQVAEQIMRSMLPLL